MWPIVVFLLALAVRAIYLVEISRSPTFYRPIIDAGTYDLLAREIAGHGRVDEQAFLQSPFYVAFLACVYLLSHGSILWAKIVQALMGALACSLTCVLGERIFSRRIGAAAGIVTALYGPLFFFEADLLPSGWAVLWVLVLLLLLLRAVATMRAGPIAAVGFCAALSVLTRPMFAAPLAACFAWLVWKAWRSPGGARAAARVALAAAAGYLVVSLPVAALNQRVTGHFGVTASSGGVNLYLGNNPDTCKTLRIRPGWEWSELARVPERAGVFDLRGKTQFYFEKFKDYVAEQPLDFAKGLALKAVQYVSSREIPRTLDIYLYRRWSRLLSATVWKAGRFGFPFGILFPLAVAGLAAHARRLPAPFLAFVFLYPLAAVLVFTASRYRLPLVPLLAILAAAGADALARSLRSGPRRHAAGLWACAGLALLVSVAPGRFCQEEVDYEAELNFQMGTRAMEEGAADAAIELFSTALRRNPDLVEAHNALGIMHFRNGDLSAAARHYADALRINPAFSFAHINLAILLEQQGRAEEAVRHLEEAIRLSPEEEQAYTLLGPLLQRLGRTGDAVERYRQALVRSPEPIASWNNLAWILATSQDAGLRDGGEAVRLAKQACERTRFGYPAYLDTLAAAYAEAGRFEEAVATEQKAIDLVMAAGRDDLTRELEQRLASYREDRPWRVATP